MVKCFSVISGRYGELLFPHILFDGLAFNVGDELFPVNMLGRVNTTTVNLLSKGERKGLVSFNLSDSECRIGLVPKTINTKPVEGLVFIHGPTRFNSEGVNKNKLYTNLRCPLPHEYWRQLSDIERSKKDSEQILAEKVALRNRYSFSYNVNSVGAKIILPEERQTNRSSYLVAMTDEASFEWVLSRKSKYPNTYRISLNKGQLTLVDPRKEARE